MIKLIPNHRNKKVEVHIQKAPIFFRNGIRSALYEVGAENVQQTKKFIYDPPKTGRVYLYRGRPHQASAPGESPAHMSGGLQRNVDYRVRGTREVEFGDKIYYGKFLEDGTMKMAPRPHIRRTVIKKQRDNYNSFVNYVWKGIK